MAKTKGRQRGSRNKGYFFRKSRGWCASEGTRAVPLADEDGARLRDERTPADVVRQAYARHLMDKRHPPVTTTRRGVVTVEEVCRVYLEHCKATGAESTFRNRADVLFDFCTGLPARCRKKKNTATRIHAGYGGLLVEQFRRLDVDQWLAIHPAWKDRRSKIQPLLRAMNYAVSAGLIERNPIKGYAAGKPRKRLTYLTPEQETACYKHSKPALATAIKVLIRTGARPGEFRALTAKHVTITPRGMEWRFAPEETKTRRLRIIRITCPEIIEIVKGRMERYRTGPLFRNTQGKPWTRPSLGNSFTSLRKRLARKKVVLDDDACLYSCRHTYAKRCLAGYWTGKPTTIEHLAALMGNTREVCWEHYAQWCDAYSDPLWESA